MQSKLTELQKMELRSKYWKGIPVQQLCKEYEISKTTAYYWISPCRTKQSFAVGMYKNVGFEIVNENAEEYIMVCQL